MQSGYLYHKNYIYSKMFTRCDKINHNPFAERSESIKNSFLNNMLQLQLKLNFYLSEDTEKIHNITHNL